MSETPSWAKQQRLDKVVSFWNSTASWRARYFANLREADPAVLSSPLQMQREFVMGEDLVIDREVKWAQAVVDLGCGVGRSLLPGIRAYPGKQFVGIDLSNQQIDRFAGVLARERHKNACAVLGDARYVPLPSAWADLVIVCNQTFGTFLGPMREAVVLEITRLLRQGGRLYIGGFDNIGIAARLYRTWGVPIVSVDRKKQFVTLRDYSSWWQDSEDVTAVLADYQFKLAESRRVRLGYLNTYTYQAG